MGEMTIDLLTKALSKALGEEVSLETPESMDHGDYATNIALVKAGKEKKNPLDLAKEIKEKLEKDEKLLKYLSKVEVAPPGFINFWLKEEFLFDEMKAIIEKRETYGQMETNKGKKMMFEYGQPNTHKLPHVGHLFSYVYGEAMTRIMEATGWEVRRVNYQGDVGLHVAKCLWAYLKEKPPVPSSLKEKTSLLQAMYQKGSQAYEEDETAQGEIQRINKKIYSQDPSIKDLWQETRGWSVDYYQAFEKRLGIKFDRYYYESEVGDLGKKKVKDNTPKFFQESQGAIIFEGSKYGLHDRVFVTKEDTPTYEAKDLYLEELKMKEYPADLLIITTAHEQNEYFKVVFRALETLHPEMKGKLKHIGFGMVSLKTGKMSSRKGSIIEGTELVEEVVKSVKGLIKDEKSLSEEEKKKVAEAVGTAAVKYSFLKNNPLQDIKFDIKESIAKEGNSGPYLQYTVARINSLLEKGNPKEISFKDLKLGDEETSLLRSLTRLSEVIDAAAKKYSPNVICTYLFDLAQKYNAFYGSQRILGEEKEGFYLVLSRAVLQVLKNGLNLLAIETPERM